MCYKNITTYAICEGPGCEGGEPPITVRLGGFLSTPQIYATMATDPG